MSEQVGFMHLVILKVASNLGVTFLVEIHCKHVVGGWQKMRDNHALQHTDITCRALLHLHPQQKLHLRFIVSIDFDKYLQLRA